MKAVLLHIKTFSSAVGPTTARSAAPEQGGHEGRRKTTEDRYDTWLGS